MLSQNQLNGRHWTDSSDFNGPLLHVAQRVSIVDRDAYEKYIGLRILYLTIDFEFVGSARVMYLQP